MSERDARAQIDAQLRAAGWQVQDRAQQNLAAAQGVAVREFPTAAGPADYLLFVDGAAVGVIEAKQTGTSLAGVEAQARAYAAALPAHVPAPIRPLPFLYEATGEETWFTDGRDPAPRAREVFQVHRPEALAAWIAEGPATLAGRIAHAPELNEAKMWPAQIQAVRNLEASIAGGRRHALIQMATGAGKTFTAITAVYRLIRFGGARRVLFLVDRGNLGDQAFTAFQGYDAPDDGRKFKDLFNVLHAESNTFPPVNRVVITTIQRLFSVLRGDPALDPALEAASAWGEADAPKEPVAVAYQPKLPPDFFDVVVVDECHRSIYTVWGQVLRYFDAVQIGLTATPSSHTYGFFKKNVVSEYRHEQAVRDRVNVPFEVWQIETRVGKDGTLIAATPDAVIGRRHRDTRELRWSRLDEDLSFGANELDRAVVVPDQIRTVLREVRRVVEAEFRGRALLPKTLIFAKDDSHAEDVLRIAREEFGFENEGAAKITYRPERGLGDAGRPPPSRSAETLVKAFCSGTTMRLAVTVDMIATGTDTKPVEVLVFLRSVKSRLLFEQMKGRGVRVMEAPDFEAVSGAGARKTRFLVFDCVGVFETQKVDPPLVRDKTTSLKKLLQRIADGDRDADLIATVAGRLDRMDRQLTPEQHASIVAVSGGTTLRQIEGGLIDALDGDREVERARELHALGAAEEPSPEQLATARANLRNAGCSAIAENPELRVVLVEIRRQQEQVIDVGTIDELTVSQARPDLQLDYDPNRELVSEFQAYVAAHRDEVDALQALYSQPYGARLTRAQIRALAAAIARPPRQWTPAALWSAYAAVEAGAVRGAAAARQWTDVVALARHALHPDAPLVPFADTVHERFEGWMAQQAQSGRAFSPQEEAWLRAIRDVIAADVEVRREDLDEVPALAARGGLGAAWAVFGERLDAVLEELNRELVA